jgi:hypothetical protein
MLSVWHIPHEDIITALYIHLGCYFRSRKTKRMAFLHYSGSLFAATIMSTRLAMRGRLGGTMGNVQVVERTETSEGDVLGFHADTLLTTTIAPEGARIKLIIMPDWDIKILANPLRTPQNYKPYL